jgi:hypothetical protein
MPRLIAPRSLHYSRLVRRVHQIAGVQVHQDSAHIDAFGNRHIDFLRSGDILLRHVELLGGELGELGVEQASSSAAGEGVVVVEDDLEAILPGLLHSGVIQLKVLGAEKFDAFRARSAAGESLQIVGGKTERGGASGFEERPP